MRRSPHESEPSTGVNPGTSAAPAAAPKVACIKGLRLILGGPGTGKTTRLVDSALAVGRSLVIAPNRGAAQRVRMQLAAAMDRGLLPTVTTFHALALSIVSQFCDEDVQLIPAAAQDVRLRELLTHAVAEGRVGWPAELQEAIGTYGMAAQVRLLIARAQSVGFGPRELKGAARSAGMPVWESVSQFLGEYLDVLDAEGVVDYPELVRRAITVVSSQPECQQLFAQFDRICVDDMHDADVSQLGLLRALASTVPSIVVAADPDQSLYRFRGADIDYVLGQLADQADESVLLTQGYRCGPTITAVSRKLIHRVGVGGLNSSIRNQLHAVQPAAHADSVEVLTSDTVTGSASVIAARIAAARDRGAIDSWSDAAVIVHSLNADLPVLQRAFRSAEIPVVVEGLAEPLQQNRAVQQLIRLLTASVEPSRFTADDARALLCSPLAGMNALTYRGLARRLVRAATVVQPDFAQRSGEAMRAEVLGEQISLDLDADSGEVQPLRSLQVLIGRLRAAAESGATVSQVLWQAWSATKWPQQLARSAARDNVAGTIANADLDAVVQLFEFAEGFDRAHLDGGAAALFLRELASQSISSDPASVVGRSENAVRILTAHAAAGRTWPMVVVAGVQDGSWPDLRPRTSLLAPERIGHLEVLPERTVRDALEDERRLFYVACTRAQRSLIVCATSSQDAGGSGQLPSRFVDEVALVDGVVRSHESGWRMSGRTLSDVIAQLRSVLQSETSSAVLKQSAAARLLALRDKGINAADPSQWWGVNEWTSNDLPARESSLIKLSGSSWESIERCSLRWFLEHEANAAMPKGNAPKIGSVVHLIADRVLRGELPSDLAAVDEQLDAVWADLGFQAEWYSQQERQEIRSVVRRFLTWHAGRESRSVIGTEIGFEHTLTVGSDQVLIRGSIDRLEITADGGVHIIDLKTSRKAETKERVREHRQLSLYQLVAVEGGLDAQLESALDAEQVAGAELVQLRVGEKNPDWPKVQQQEPIDPDAVRQSLAQVVEVIKTGRYAPNPDSATCRVCPYSSVCPSTSKEVIT